MPKQAQTSNPYKKNGVGRFSSISAVAAFDRSGPSSRAVREKEFLQQQAALEREREEFEKCE